MAAGQTTLSGVDANGNAVHILAGSDVAGDISPGHTLFDVTGVPQGTLPNPLRTSGIGTTLISRSVSSTAISTSTQLMPANASRRIMRVQAPQTEGIWINPLGGVCGVGTIDSFFLPAGSLYESTDTNAVTYFDPTGGSILSAVEG